MFYSYDPFLVVASVVIAVVGAYSCFGLVSQVRKHQLAGREYQLIAAALAIGGSIWAMHFVAMLAVNLPVEIRYDFFTTLFSGLAAVLVTAVALLIVLPGNYQLRRIALAGLLLGLGVAGMHYVGMAAIRGNCVLSYSNFWVIASVLVAVVASSAALWAALTLQATWACMAAALIMGLSISGMHFTAMLGTAFISIDNAVTFSQAVISPQSLGLAIAVMTLVILGWAIQFSGDRD